MMRTMPHSIRKVQPVEPVPFHRSAGQPVAGERASRDRLSANNRSDRSPADRRVRNDARSSGSSWSHFTRKEQWALFTIGCSFGSIFIAIIALQGVFGR